jgi:hypothetical protein
MLTWVLLGGSLLLALFLVGQQWQTTRRPMDTKLGPLGWSFTDSWASNLTGLLALFATLSATELVPQANTDAWLPGTTYAALGALFGGLVLAAPLVYLALANPEKGSTDTTRQTEPPDVHYQGCVKGFLLATTLVLWALFGQLGVSALLITELLRSTLPWPIGVLLLLLAVVVFIAGGVHAAHSIGFILRELAKPDPKGLLTKDLRRLEHLYTSGRAPRWILP